MFPLPELSNYDRINYSALFKVDDKRFVRDQNWYWSSLLDTNTQFIHKMNRYGFRDKEWEILKPKGKQRIMVVGDSFVEGIMSSQEKTIPKGLKKADAKGDLEVMNCGMMGISLNEYLKFITHSVPVFKPDLVVLCLFTNDFFLDSIIFPNTDLQPQYYNTYYPRLFELSRQIKKGSPVKWRWSFDAKPFIPYVPRKANPWTDHADVLKEHVSSNVIPHMKKGTLNPYRTNQLFAEEKKLSRKISFYKALSYLKNFLSKHKTKFAVVYIPARHLITNHYFQYDRQACLKLCDDNMSFLNQKYHQHYLDLESDCGQLNIPYYDLLGFVRKNEKSGKHLYWNYDDHMRGSSYLKIGCLIHDFLKKEKLLSN